MNKTNLPQDQASRYRSFGYTHWVSWEESIPHLGIITKGFPTTPDAVDRYIVNLTSKGFVPVVTLL